MGQLVKFLAMATAVVMFTTAPASAKTVKVVFKAVEKEWQWDNAGSKMPAYTFDGAIPGPVVRVAEGDDVEFTLINENNNAQAHSMDFHAARVNVLSEFKEIQPGETKNYTFKATYPGVFFISLRRHADAGTYRPRNVRGHHC